MEMEPFNIYREFIYFPKLDWCQFMDGALENNFAS